MNVTACRGITARLLPAASAGAGVTAAFTTAGHSAIVCITTAVAIAVSGLAALAREWFWYSALRRPARNLDRLHQLTGQEISDTERLMRLVQDGENNVLTARAAASGHPRNHKASWRTQPSSCPGSSGLKRSFS